MSEIQTINATDLITQIKNDTPVEKCGIQINYYLPIATKQAIIEQVKLNALEEENGMVFVNPVSKYLAIRLILINFYTNIEGDYNYDELEELGVINYIDRELLNNNPTDYINLLEMIDEAIESEKERKNSLAAVLNRNLQLAISKIPDEKGIKRIIAYAPKHLNKIQNLEALKGIFQQNVK